MAAPAPLLPLDDPRPRRNQPTITCAAAIAAGKDALYLSLLPKELCALVDNMIPCCGWQWTGKPVAVPLPEEVVRSACPDASYAVTDVGHVVVLKKTLKSGAGKSWMLNLNKKPTDAAFVRSIDGAATLIDYFPDVRYVVQEERRRLVMRDMTHRQLEVYLGRTTKFEPSSSSEAKLDSHGWICIDGTRVFHIKRPSRVFRLPDILDLDTFEAYGTEGSEMVKGFDPNINLHVVYNLRTTTRVHICEYMTLWRPGGVLIDLPGKCLVGAYSMERLMTLRDDGIGQAIYTSRWLILGGANSVTYHSTAYRDRAFKVEFGDWRLHSSYATVADFRRGAERMLWCWHECIGVRTDLSSPALCRLELINGAVFAYHEFAEKLSEVHIVPLNDVLPSVSSEQLPPGNLPSDPAMRRSRLLLTAPRGGVRILPPLNSDTHPPLLLSTDGKKLYRIQ